MMRAMISAIAIAALVVVATSLLKSKTPSIELSTIELSTAAMPPLQELHEMANVNKLPIQEIEDQSLVYPTVAKR
jgi:hypothetical protein